MKQHSTFRSCQITQDEHIDVLQNSLKLLQNLVNTQTSFWQHNLEFNNQNLGNFMKPKSLLEKKR